ncbi:MAG TPA: hypothetical protein VHR86_05725, partial [Armatimonadota bacterium]|nr:hypothetical protein [Armatimonadota bacterium]
MEAFGLVGNGRVLARILDNGTLTEMFFPSIGFYRHIIQSQFGFTEAGGDLYWLSDKRLDRRQYYLEDTNVLVTAARRDGLLIEVADFVPMEQAAVVRKVELRNTRPTPISLRFYHVEAASLEENRDNFSNNMTYYDTIHRCLV